MRAARGAVPAYRYDPERGPKDLRTAKPVYYVEPKTVRTRHLAGVNARSRGRKAEIAVFVLFLLTNNSSGAPWVAKAIHSGTG